MKVGVSDDVGSEMTFQIAPLIDLTFQLMIFFMCASHWNVIQSVELEIPTALKAVVPKERPDRVVVNIQKDGSMFRGNVPIASIEELKALIKEQKAEIPDLKVYLRADKETNHVMVKKVMAAMAEEGIDDFIFGAFLRDD